jgi:hypothetical protein
VTAAAVTAAVCQGAKGKSPLQADHLRPPATSTQHD